MALSLRAFCRYSEASSATAYSSPGASFDRRFGILERTGHVAELRLGGAAHGQQLRVLRLLREARLRQVHRLVRQAARAGTSRASAARAGMRFGSRSIAAW